MNKQEKEDLIQALYDIGGCEAEDEWTRGYDDGVNASIEVIKELEVQEKAIVPKFVAIELDKLKDKYLTLRDLYTGDVNWLNNGTFYLEGKELELAKWVNKNETTFEYAWIHGYEVEKEQLYYVKFDILYLQKYLVKNVETDQFYLSNNEKVVGNYEQVKFTEQEIKAIDERYWPFAVKVGNE
ncbi:DUF1642 domain-containing protein [Enterococcus faecalis]|uniref:DUF1642 domain-containing protein n=1 Tax=Enterococcus faecalis TaxID=1351 RepID=UPI000CF084F3|nr:DUF1642 domain-containing protein [Enterococcus faecalis]EGO2676764.1 DUF1642 domain-containing protein [Enterococcus faecalis]EGO2846159.1 DUF1642 domain-containing protein [Enterococcus faecalis]EGO5240062.1 DUF1642 domain-containing protein [Enterococcus faecalis]EGO7804644.1 DUF1642 domain-containing protein [Enterococcus faecalis]EGO8303713.1 DUF1642 domain-containing protein [Enterococcus faecalis]